MPNPVFDGMADVIFSALSETSKAKLIQQHPVDGPQVETLVDLIFNERHQDVDFRGVGIGEPRPTGWVKSADVEHPPKYGDTVELNNKQYKITEVSFDGIHTYRMTMLEGT